MTGAKMAIHRDRISGTTGREPVGVVLSCGVKKAGGGYPVEKDRFHLVVPREDNGVRPHHPAFAAFNAAATGKRQLVRGNLVHGTKGECWEGYLRAQTGPKSVGMHPNRRPFCQGDGVRAERWSGEEPDDYMAIQCPNERCEYRLTTPPACKPFSRLLFRLRWPDGNPLPSMLCKYTSGGWYTYSNLLGFFDYLENSAKQIGLEQYSLFGFPFSLALTQQTKPAAKTRFPVVVIAPEADPVEFFARQSEQLSQLRGTAFEALEDQRAADIEFEDVKALTVPGAD
jgi:hypothetical protein